MSEHEHEGDIKNARTFWDWIKNRGGLAVWQSINLSNPDASWTTPALTEDGKPMPKPTWQVGEAPTKVITDPAKVLIRTYEEVKRFRVGLRQAGLTIKVTDGGSRRIRSAVAKAGEDATYTFDYETQEAVILKPAKTITLAEWAQALDQQPGV